MSDRYTHDGSLLVFAATALASAISTALSMCWLLALPARAAAWLVRLFGGLCALACAWLLPELGGLSGPDAWVMASVGGFALAAVALSFVLPTSRAQRGTPQSER